MTALSELNPTARDAADLLDLTDELARRGFAWPCSSCRLVLVTDPVGAEACTHLAVPQSYEDMLRECYAESRMPPYEAAIAELQATSRRVVPARAGSNSPGTAGADRGTTQ